MFPKWAKGDTKICKFLQDLDPHKKYTKEEMKQYCIDKSIGDNRKGCINRDKNGCKNIRYVFNYYKKTGKRPERFRREYKLERIASTTETKVEVVKCANA